MNRLALRSLLFAAVLAAIIPSDKAVAQRGWRFGDPPVLNPANGHYYEVIRAYVHFDDALNRAAARTHLSIRGHLSTITSKEEDDFLSSTFPFSFYVWVGASDEAVEGEWRWVAGPEAGQLFWVGDSQDGTALGYENWGKYIVDGVVKYHEEKNLTIGAMKISRECSSIVLASTFP